MSVKKCDGLVAVVTGGGSGIGQDLALVDVSRKGLQETREKIDNLFLLMPR